MNEVIDVDVSLVANDMLDVVDLGDACEETKQVNPTPVVIDSHMQIGFPG